MAYFFGPHCIYTREVVLCTGSSTYICPNSLLYIQGEVVQFSWSIMLRRSVVGDHARVAGVSPSDSFSSNRYNHYRISSLAVASIPMGQGGRVPPIFTLGGDMPINVPPISGSFCS